MTQHPQTTLPPHPAAWLGTGRQAITPPQTPMQTPTQPGPTQDLSDPLGELQTQRMLAIPPARARLAMPLLPLAIATWLSLPFVWPRLSGASKRLKPSSPVWPPKKSPANNRELLKLVARVAKGLKPLLSRLPDPLTAEDAAAFQQALWEAALARTHRFVRGLKAYQLAPLLRDDIKPGRVIWMQGTTKLRNYAARLSDKGPIVLVVPSLVNRLDILDLDQDYSFLRYLATKGFRPLAVDWEAPGPTEQDFGLADYVQKRLTPALLRAYALNEGKPVPVIGYCMGGALALAMATLHKDKISALALLATPWDFHAGGSEAAGAVGRAVVKLMEKIDPLLRGCGYLPVSLLQTMFLQVQPVQVVEKFARFAVEDPASLLARRFVLTEDWLNDGVPLTATVARECLAGWYGSNDPFRGAWRIAGLKVDPSAFDKPTYIVVPTKDRIVDPNSARPLAQLMPQATLVEPAFGHIGLMSSPQAREKVWDPLVSWLSGVPGVAPGPSV